MEPKESEKSLEPVETGGLREGEKGLRWGGSGIDVWERLLLVK